MDAQQFTKYIIRPALKHMGLYSREAEQLVLGTSLTESRLKYIKQIGSGPALGFFQMEPATHDDILKNFVAYKTDLWRRLMALVPPGSDVKGTHLLQWNLLYAAAMCRLHYYRKKEPLPRVNDLEAMGRYWKKHYNTHLGAGTVEHFVEAARPVLEI